MMNLIEQLEHSVQEFKKLTELDNALERLMQNRDFKNVILDGYLEREAVRLVHLKSDPAMDSPAAQTSILKQIDAIGCFADYLREIQRQGSLGTKGIGDAEEVLEELRAGGVEE